MPTISYAQSYPTLSHLRGTVMNTLSNLTLQLPKFQWHGCPAYIGKTANPASYFLVPLNEFCSPFSMMPSGSNIIMGFDVPVLIYPDTEPKGTIFILAQDPLRNLADYVGSGISFTNDVIVGLPFAVQCIPPATKPNTIVWHGQMPINAYDGIITQLLNKGYAVYLTDVVKFYIGQVVKTPKSGKSKQISVFKPGRKGWKLFRNILKDEINTINPVKILAFGSKARETLDSIGVINPSLRVDLPHPSGRNPYWNGKNLSGKEKVDYLMKEICQSFQKPINKQK